MFDVIVLCYMRIEIIPGKVVIKINSLEYPPLKETETTAVLPLEIPVRHRKVMQEGVNK